MAISVQTLFNSTLDAYRLNFIAGDEGGSRSVSWVYYTEDVSTLNFLRGGELVVTTGMEIGRMAANTGKDVTDFTVEYLSELINTLTKQNAAGLILNVGKYILGVPIEITELCNRLRFPLLTMPWEIHIIDLTQDYGNRIITDRQKRQSLKQSIYNLMFNKKEFDEEHLDNTIFKTAKKFSVALVECPQYFSKMDEESFFRYMEYFFIIGIKNSEFVYFRYKDKIVYVFPAESNDYIKKIEKAVRRDKKFEKMKIAVSGNCESVFELHSEYRHAELAIKMCDPETLMGDYEKLGIYQLLGEIEDTRILEKLYEKTLGALNIFGKEKLDDYLNTLKLYLESSGKVAKTAEENFTHRNTVNYRIRKICDTLKIDLGNGKTRYMIQTALYIRELLQLE